VVLRWHAQELADDDDRERVREVGHDVHTAVAASFDLVEPLVDDRLDAQAEPLDHLGCERLADEATQAGVIRRILEQHDHIVHLVHGVLVECRSGFGERLVELRVLLVGAEVRIAHDRRHVGVAGHEVHAERRVVHRFVLAQQRKELVGILAELGCERDAQEVECLLGRLCHRAPHGPVRFASRYARVREGST
jgi:hypothetical protein